jgi:isochorismate synthase
MWHLSTEVRGRLRDPAVCALQLATALHPTPAVCGTPTDVAMSTIRELEGFDRGFYAGLVGWSDVTGDGEWVVTIRCGEVEDRRIRMFAGAGIVADSDAEDELRETTAKLRTVLAALGLEP